RAVAAAGAGSRRVRGGRRPADRMGSRRRRRIRARVLRGLASAIGGPLPRLRVGLLVPGGSDRAAMIPAAEGGTISAPTRSGQPAHAAGAGARTPVLAGVGA